MSADQTVSIVPAKVCLAIVYGTDTRFKAVVQGTDDSGATVRPDLTGEEMEITIRQTKRATTTELVKKATIPDQAANGGEDLGKADFFITDVESAFSNIDPDTAPDPTRWWYAIRRKTGSGEETVTHEGTLEVHMTTSDSVT